jgi:hypothetical protein
MDTEQSLRQPTASALVDILMDVYCDWRTACASVRAAYARWLSASPSEREPAFTEYRDALDHEERASTMYERYVGLVAAEFTE